MNTDELTFLRRLERRTRAAERQLTYGRMREGLLGLEEIINHRIIELLEAGQQEMIYCTGCHTEHKEGACQ